MNLDALIRKIPNWPKPGILFYDVTTLFENPEAFRYMIDELCRPYQYQKIDKIVGIDARGFLLASTMAYKLNSGLSIVRKKGKLPYKTISKDYVLEYDSNTIEMHEDTIKPGEKVIVVDDLVATGGTIKAAIELIEQLGGIVVGVSWIVDLPFLGGSDKIKKYPCYYLLQYNSEKVEENISGKEKELNLLNKEKISKPVKIGIIGGSGLENLDILENIKKLKVNTPFGQTSDIVTIGKVKDPSHNTEVVIIPRHGRDHLIMPTEVNYRANIWAMKKMGVTHILATTACGSLKENIKPGDFVLIDQFIDRTTKRHQTFYQGRVCHIPMAEPFCPQLRTLIHEAAVSLKIPTYHKGTAITIEGPRFSTKAESNLFRSWGADIINMTTVPEGILAREAGICYQPIAMVTDYDCWHESEEEVGIQMVLEVMKENNEKVKALLSEVIKRINHQECACMEAIKNSII